MIRFLLTFCTLFVFTCTMAFAQQTPAQKATSAKAIAQKSTVKLKAQQRKTKANSIQAKAVMRTPQVVGSSRQPAQLNIATKEQLQVQRKRIAAEITKLNTSQNPDAQMLKKYQHALDQTDAIIKNMK